MPFDRLGAEHSRVEGSGIGLVIAKRLLELMQGRLGLLRTSHQGSHFYLDLPFAGD
jgi:signal transduction histidine kinase